MVGFIIIGEDIAKILPFSFFYEYLCVYPDLFGKKGEKSDGLSNFQCDITGRLFWELVQTAIKFVE